MEEEECASDVTTASSLSANEAAVSTNAQPYLVHHVKPQTEHTRLLHEHTELPPPPSPSPKQQQQDVQPSNKAEDNVIVTTTVQAAGIHVLSVTHDTAAVHTDAPAIVPHVTHSVSSRASSASSLSSPSSRLSSTSPDAHVQGQSATKGQMHSRSTQGQQQEEDTVDVRAGTSTTPPPPRSSLAHTACYEDTPHSNSSSDDDDDEKYEEENSHDVGEVNANNTAALPGADKSTHITAATHAILTGSEAEVHPSRRYIPLVSPAIASSPEATPNTASASPHRPTLHHHGDNEMREHSPDADEEEDDNEKSSSTSKHTTPRTPTARTLAITTITQEEDKEDSISTPHAVSYLTYAQRREQLCEAEGVLRELVEYDEHRARQDVIVEHKCMIDALDTAQSIALQESTLRLCMEAEARLALQQLRQRSGEAEVARLREAVRQRALLIETERRVRREGVVAEEESERAELQNLFRVGLAAWLRQNEVRRRRAKMRLGAAAESCVFAEMKARAECEVSEGKARTLLYDDCLRAEAALLVHKQGEVAHPTTGNELEEKEEEGQNYTAAEAAKTVLEAEQDDVSEITALDEADEVIEHQTEEAAVNHHSALPASHAEGSSTPCEHEEEEEEGGGEESEDVEYFEWNPTHNSSAHTTHNHTTNTTTMTTSNTSGDAAMMSGTAVQHHTKKEDKKEKESTSGTLSHEESSPSPSVAHTTFAQQPQQTSTQDEQAEENTQGNKEPHAASSAVVIPTETNNDDDNEITEEGRSRSATVRVTPAKALLTSMSQALRSAGDERSARKAEALLLLTTSSVSAQDEREAHDQTKEEAHAIVTKSAEEEKEVKEESCSSTTSTSVALDEDRNEDEPDDEVEDVVEIAQNTPLKYNNNNNNYTMRYNSNNEKGVNKARAAMASVVTRHTVPCSLHNAPADSYHAFLDKYGGAQGTQRLPPPTMRRCRSSSSASSRSHNAENYTNGVHRSSSALREDNNNNNNHYCSRAQSNDRSEERVLLPPRPYRTRIVYGDDTTTTLHREMNENTDDTVPLSSAAGVLRESTNTHGMRRKSSPQRVPHYLQPTQAWAAQESEKEIVRVLRYCSQHSSPCPTPTRTRPSHQHEAQQPRRPLCRPSASHTRHASPAQAARATPHDKVDGEAPPLPSEDTVTTTTCADTSSVHGEDSTSVVPDLGSRYDCAEEEEGGHEHYSHAARAVLQARRAALQEYNDTNNSKAHTLFSSSSSNMAERAKRCAGTDTVQRKCAPRRRLTALIPRRDTQGQDVPYSYVNVFLRRYAPSAMQEQRYMSAATAAAGSVKDATHAAYDALVTSPAPASSSALLLSSGAQQGKCEEAARVHDNALVRRQTTPSPASSHASPSSSSADNFDVVSNTTVNSTPAAAEVPAAVEKESIRSGEAAAELEEEGGEAEDRAMIDELMQADELSETDEVPYSRSEPASLSGWGAQVPRRPKAQPSPLRRHALHSKDHHYNKQTTTTSRNYGRGAGDEGHEVPMSVHSNGYAALHARRRDMTPYALPSERHESSAFGRSLPYTPSRLLRFTPT